MKINLPVIASPKTKKGVKVDSSFSKWTVFSLCIITTLIVVAIIKAIIPLLFFGLILSFIWSQATKPVAQLEGEKKPSGKQLNLFYQNQISKDHLKNRIKNEKGRRAA